MFQLTEKGYRNRIASLQTTYFPESLMAFRKQENMFAVSGYSITLSGATLYELSNCARGRVRLICCEETGMHPDL